MFYVERINSIGRFVVDNRKPIFSFLLSACEQWEPIAFSICNIGERSHELKILSLSAVCVFTENEWVSGNG